MVSLFLLAGCAHFEPRPIAPAETAASFDARTLDNPQLRAFVEKNLPRHFDAWPPASWDFETLALAAYYYHPSLDVARAQWQTARGGERTAGALPNPTVIATPGYDFNYTELSPWLPSIEFDFPIETAGKRGYRKAQARHEAESARLNLAVAAWQVRANLRTSLIDLAAAHAREEILRSEITLQEQIVRALEQQLQAGAIAAYEVTQPRIALGKLQLDLADARQKAADARVSVADAIGLPARAVAGVDFSYDLSVRPPAADDLNSSHLRDEALTNRADILGALADYAAAQSALQLEIAKQYPDINLGPGYTYDHGEHTFTFAITAELPIFDQNQGPIAEATARRTEAAARFNALQAKVISNIDRAATNYQVTAESLVTLESVAAAQRSQTDSVNAQFQAGAVDHLELLNAQLELAAGELERLDARVKLHESFAALEDAVQRPMDAPGPAVLPGPRPQAHNQSKP